MVITYRRTGGLIALLAVAAATLAAAATPRPHETIDATVVTRTNSSDPREPPRLDGGTG
jgi:hypothetical protein